MVSTLATHFLRMTCGLFYRERTCNCEMDDLAEPVFIMHENVAKPTASTK
jgi:hypothetical protein